MLAIAAQIPSHELGSQYFQETRPEILFQDCSHYCELISTPHRCPGRWDWPFNRPSDGGASQSSRCRGMFPCWRLPPRTAPFERPALSVDDPAVRNGPENLAERLNRSKKVTILGGAGCAGAHSELMQTPKP